MLRTLRVEIVRLLGEFTVTVIPEEDLEWPVRWLRASEEVAVGLTAEPLTVRDAFFFRSV